jgi:hypothetical protein
MPGKIPAPQATAHHHSCFFLPMFLPTLTSPVTTTTIQIWYFFLRESHHISIYKWAPLPSLNSLFPSSPPPSLRLPRAAPVAYHLPSPVLVLSLSLALCPSIFVLQDRKNCHTEKNKISRGDTAKKFTCHLSSIARDVCSRAIYSFVL